MGMRTDKGNPEGQKRIPVPFGRSSDFENSGF